MSTAAATPPEGDPHAVADAAEKRWAIIVVAIIGFLVLMMVVTGLHWAAMPPSRVETVDVRTLTADDIHGRSVLLNFWAPWCPPCVREMPEIDRFARSPAGKDTLVVGLAIDEVPAVKKFLAEHPVGFPVVVLGYAGLNWVRRLGNDGGALPFSVVFDPGQHVAHRKAGPTTAAELAGWTSRF